MNYLRINSLRLFLVAITLLIATVLKAEIKTGSMGDNVAYTLDTESGEVVITGTGAMWECFPGFECPFRFYNIEKVTIGKGVTNISSMVFCDCGSLTSVEISESVTSIGNRAFMGCYSLTSIVIPSSVTDIDYMAFAGTPWINTYITDINNHWGNIVYINNVAYQAISKDIQNCEFKQGTTSICHTAFSGCSSLTSIVIPSSVTSIGGDAFSGCSSLTSIEIPESVTSIGNGAFQSTPWYKSYREDTNNQFGNIIYINDVAYEAISKDIQNCEFKQGTISISDRAFYECNSLTSINIPSGVTSIGDRTFYGCSSLISIEIPSGVTSIGDYAFTRTALVSVKIPASVKSIGLSAFQTISSFDHDVPPIDKVEIESIESLLDIQFAQDSSAISLYSNPLSNGAHLYINGEEVIDVVIPEGVKKINKFAFIGAKYIRSITLPQSLEYIGDWAFGHCTDLRSITFPPNVSYIGNGALRDCTLSINNQSKCVSVNNWAAATVVDEFTEDGLGIRNDTVITCSKSATSVTIPSNITSIGSHAFWGCSSLTSIDIPDGVTNIGDKAFEGTPWYKSYTENTNNQFGNIIYINDVAYEAVSKDIQNCELKQGTISISNRAFYECNSLTSINIPSGVISIGDETFRGCSSLTSIEIPTSVTSIGNWAFGYCSSLTSIEIPTSVTSIDDYAFRDCSSLTSIEIPASVTSIGIWAFAECNSLNSIYMGDTPPAIDTYTFGYYVENRVIYVPAGCIEAYRNAPYWSEFLKIQEYTNGSNDDEETIQNNTITYTSSDGMVISPHNMDAFGANIISNVYENGIGVITFDGEVSKIGSYAFQNCRSLTSIEIPTNVTSIGSHAIEGCSSLISIEIPASVTSIGDDAFSSCSSIKSIVVDGNNTVYDSRNDCNAIIKTATNELIKGCSSTIIPASVTNIGFAAFSGCSSLTSIEIPASVTNIGNYAFSSCSSLTSIEIPASVTSIGTYAFSNCSSLTDISNLASIPQQIANGVFAKATLTTATLYVPHGSLQAYQNAPFWHDFGTIVELEPNPTDLSLYPNALYASPTEARAGTTVTIPINMKNSVTATGFSLSLVLPEAIVPSAVTLKKSKVRKEDEVSFSKAVQPDGSIKVVCYSSDGRSFADNDGEVATLTFTVPADMEAGDYHLIIKNAEISENGKAHKIAEEIISLLHVESYIPGDANMDGELSVSDLTIIVNYILKLDMPDTFYLKAADANEDGDVSVSDLSTIINILLYGSPSASTQSASLRYDPMGRPISSIADAPIIIGQDAKTIIQ